MKKWSCVVKAASIAACGVLFASNAVAADRTWTGLGGDGEWQTAENWSDNAVPSGTGDVAIFDGMAVTVEVSNNHSIKTIRSVNGADVTINIADGVRFTIDNSGAEGLGANGGDITINGPGKLGMTTRGGLDHLDHGADRGSTLAIYAEIVDSNGGTATGFETWRSAATTPGGTVILGCPTNAFTMDMNAAQNHTIIAHKLAPAGQPSCFGAISAIQPNRNTVIRYTGTGDTAGYAFRLNGGDANFGYGAGIEHAGTGPLIWTGDIYGVQNNTQFLTLSGDSAYPASITGNIYDNNGTVGITKNGSGTWVLAGNNSFTGNLTVNGGALGLDSPTAAGDAAQIAMAGGTTLSVNPSGAAGFVTALQPISVAGACTIDLNPSGADNFDVTFASVSAPDGFTLAVADAPNASTVTISVLSATTVNVIAPSAGTAVNRIFIANLSAGALHAAFTLNGGPAQYDLTDGLKPLSLFQQGIAVKGGTLPDGPTTQALINLAAVSQNPIQFTDLTSLFSLTMDFSGDDATVDTSGKTLLANELAINAGKGALTLGVAPQDGALLPLGFTPLPAPVIPGNAAISSLNPLIWWDPSDAGTVTIRAGHISQILNKGTSAATHNAVVSRDGHTAPPYATGKDSHSALPMVWINANTHSLDSANNTGISGNSERTLIAVVSYASGAENNVSMGVNQDRRDFSIRMGVNVSGVLNVRFNTWNGDKDIVAPPAATPAVLSFWNNAENSGNSWLGAALDGALAEPWEANANNLSTDNTKLRLGYTDNAGNPGRGQIGEVLLFDRTLTDQERETVEAYLMDKWLQPKFALATPESGTVVLRNDSTADLTVNAAIAEPTAESTISLVKRGTGNVTLAGGTVLSGLVQISEGALTVDTPAPLLDTFANVIAGTGKLVKDGTGTLFLPSTANNLYTGGTDILDGILKVGHRYALGSGDVTIADGATLDIGGATAADSVVINNRITVSGAGKDGLGAIVNNGAVQQRYAFQNTTITMAGPTTIGGNGTPRWDIVGMDTTLDMNGHALTKVGVADFRISPANVINAPEGLALDIRQGTLGIESGTIMHPNDSLREIHIGGSGRFGLYMTSIPLNWPITSIGDGAQIWTYGGNENTNLNMLAGDIYLNDGATLHLTADGAVRNKNLLGQITGPGNIRARDQGVRTMSLLSHPNNTFEGNVTVANHVLGLRHPGSLPDLNKLTLEGSGCVRVFMGGPGEWESADVAALVNRPGLYTAGDRRFQVHVDLGQTATLSDPLAYTGTFDKNGQGTLVIESDVTLTASSRMNNGTIRLTGNAVWNSGRENMYTSDYTVNDGTGTPFCTFTIEDHAQYISPDSGYNTGGGTPSLRAAHNGGKAVIELKDNAYVESGIMVGGWENANDATTAHGAVYQSGDSEWRCTSGAANDGRIGRWGYGYYQLDSGTFSIKGWSHLGGINNATSVGILRQTGGTFAFNGKRYAAPENNGDLGDSYAGCFGLSRGGVGVLHLEGGAFTHYGELLILDPNDGGSGTATAGTGIMTVDGTADAVIDRQIEIGNRPGGFAALSLNGGKLTTTHIYRRYPETPSTVAISFNGGTLSVTNNADSADLFVLEAGSPDLAINVYEGGATIDIGEGITRDLSVPLASPYGFGVSVIAASGGSGYIAPPHVSITGGGGSGATAIARIDRGTDGNGYLTGIEITSPGSGYTSTPSVTLVGGGGGGVTLSAAVITPNPSGGGFTKTGPGALTLSAPNTYTGPTRVNGGTLILNRPDAIHPRSAIIIGDGTLDLNGHTITNVSLALTGSGGIVNGTVVTASAVKTGPGASTLDAGIVLIAVETGFAPGMWEGRLSGRLNRAAANPCTAVELTTTAANGYLANAGEINGKYWPDNSTWIYSGYIWNPSESEETWTFAKSFDDDVLLTIDGEWYIDHPTHNQIFKTNVVVSPGPHPIEIRFGQGGGGVGAVQQGWWQTRAFGLGVDYLGRGADVFANYVPLGDPGDGSRLTLFDIPDFAEPDGLIRVEEGTLVLPGTDPGALSGMTVTVADGAVLDLGGAPHNGLTVTGPGTVQNGAAGSANGTILTPGGDDRTATMGVSGALNGMTYRVTIHDPPIPIYITPFTPGLYEGRVSQGGGNVDRSQPNPRECIEMTYTAANGWSTGDNVYINGKLWPFYTTYIYTGYLWSHAETNETWTFAKSFDDHLILTVNGVQYMDHGAYNAVAKVQVLINPGPNAIEMRFGQGNGGVGAMKQTTPGNEWWTDDTMALGVDKLGRNENVMANYELLEDPGDGSVFTLEGEVPPPVPGDNGMSDLLVSAETLDLTGLTIVPSDVISDAPPGNKYLIATAAGFTGVPVVSGFTGGRKWQIRKDGGNLWLTTQGGTVLILR